MPKIVNLVGQKFGKLLVTKGLGQDHKFRKIWECECECGNIHNVATSNLTSNKVKSCGCARHKPKRHSFIIGQKFNKILITGESRVEIYILPNGKKLSKVWYSYQCDCGATGEILAATLKNNYIGCNQCRYKGYRDLSGAYWGCLKNGAKIRNIKFNLEIEFAWNLFLKQNKKCNLTGRDLALVRKYGSEKDRQTASLDRINSNLPYIDTNVQWIHKDLQTMKGSLDNEEFVQKCKMVAQYDIQKVKE